MRHSDRARGKGDVRIIMRIIIHIIEQKARGLVISSAVCVQFVFFTFNMK